MNSGSSKMGPPTSIKWLPNLAERVIFGETDQQDVQVLYSLNLNSHPDFYLLKYSKDNIYQNHPQTIGEVKAAIKAEIREIE